VCLLWRNFGWLPPSKFPKRRMNEDETCWKMTSICGFKGLKCLHILPKVYLLFRESFLRIYSEASLLWSNLRMGDLLESFPDGMWSRMKCARKACSDLQGQLTVLEAVSDSCPRPVSGCYTCSLIMCLFHPLWFFNHFFILISTSIRLCL